MVAKYWRTRHSRGMEKHHSEPRAEILMSSYTQRGRMYSFVKPQLSPPRAHSRCVTDYTCVLHFASNANRYHGVARMKRLLLKLVAFDALSLSSSELVEMMESTKRKPFHCFSFSRNYQTIPHLISHRSWSGSGSETSQDLIHKIVTYNIISNVLRLWQHSLRFARDNIVIVFAKCLGNENSILSIAHIVLLHAEKNGPEHNCGNEIASLK